MYPKKYTGVISSQTGATTTTVLDTVSAVSLEGPAGGTFERLHVSSLQLQSDAAGTAPVDVQLVKLAGGVGSPIKLWEGGVSSTTQIKIGTAEGLDNEDLGESLGKTDVLQIVIPQTAAIQKVWYDVEAYIT